MAYESKFQGVARTFIPGMIKAGYSAAAGLRLFQSEGLGYRKKEFLADWREFSGREAKKDVTKYIPKHLKPTSATMSVTTDNLKGQYSYIYEVRGRDTLTGEAKTQMWRHTSDELMTMEDVESIVEKDIVAEEYEVRITDIYLVPSEVLSRVRL